jgi:AraC-like DNA-binding protein
MNAKLSPDTQVLQACDIGEFEERARGAQIHMLATQLDRGQAQVRCRTRMVGEAVLSAYCVSHSLAVDWIPRPGSLNFSIQVGPSGMLFGGRERPSSSVIAYVEPASSNWTGVIPADQGTGAETIHISVPLESAESLEIDSKYLSRGLVNLPIEKHRAQEFADWASKCFVERTCSDEQRDEMFMWMCSFLKPSRPAHNNIESPSHYDRIIRDVNRIADQSPGETPTVFLLATRLRVSVRTLQRAFHATFGVGVGRYLRNRRLRAAHELLKSGEFAVAPAAIATGFHHVARFAQQYRELYGCYPSDTLAFSR